MIVSGIYSIVNKVNGKKYIGSSININNRYKQHIAMLKRGRHHSIALQRAWDKYGKDQFELVIICMAPEEYLLKLEQKFLNSLFGDNLYNISKDAVAWMKGRKHSPETLAKMHTDRLGNKSRTGYPGHWKGQKLSQEHIANMKKSRQFVSQETREKMSLSKKGKSPPNKGKFSTHCKKGHELNENNLISGRRCKKCRNLREQKYRNKGK